ncbi:MAG: DUF4270 domain-containing protein [Bacteroidales bacterium]
MRISEIRMTAGRMIRFFVILLPLAILFSCEKDPDLVGMDVTPDQDQLFVEVTDTFTIEAYSVMEDSLTTGFTSLNLVGAAYDPVFGKLSSGFATQFMLSTVNPSFGDNPVMDSLVLILAYNGYYGDTNTKQTIHVYELDEDLYKDSTYYSNHEVRHKGVDYAHHVFFPRPTDSITIDDTITIPPILRLDLGKIRPDLANKILFTPADNLASSAKFTEYFKGLYISADPVSYGGSILYFNLLSSGTLFRIYYHNDDEDSLHYDLVVNENAARFNRFDHYNYDFASQALRRQVVYKDTSLGNQVLYVQSMSGVKVKMKFPHLKKWAQQHKMAINEAQLILPVYEDSPELTPVAKLLPVLLDEDGTYSNLPDAGGGDNYFGGSYNSGTNEYKFRITQYIQNVIKDNYEDYGMYILASGASVRANRVQLAGAGHPLKPIKLRITYSYLH